MLMLFKGTRPFMSLEALDVTKSNFIHTPGHDLESLLYVILTVCHITDGPFGRLRVPERDKKAPPFCKWFEAQEDWEDLMREKAILLQGFDRDLGPHFSQYWQPLVPHVKQLVEATFHGLNPYYNGPNKATHETYRKMLEDALAALPVEDLHPYALLPTSAKRSRGEASQNRPSKIRCIVPAVRPS